MIKEFFTENVSYKLVSLFIALILWTTILGRRDFIYSRTIDLDFRASPGFSVVAQPEQVRLRVSGTRSSLRRFMEATASQSLLIDLTSRGPSVIEMNVPLDKIDIPLGVKVLSVRPSVIRAEIVPLKPSTPEGP
ncbi:MAG: hypothetical protein KF802_00730 [Bdellovibrionaceae bacterium]|nr:hypothetical protein [Pseudobdellovibrionaceae bacterium]MBX3035114.1 hypothetical protein [Pseudobdellovibrionaceae bacterium]